jgi:putative ubiquitin-RnfH superfamily antitoxin RatB of RatAB toxin-antitoxin module
MRVQLVRAWPNRCDTVEVTLDERGRVGDALDAAGWRLDGEFVALSVFGVAASTETRLHPGDRIELLRPLKCDPMQARRLRAGKTGARRG